LARCVDGDDLFIVMWDGCDLVVETMVGFEIRTLPNADGDQEFTEIVIEDRLCVTEMEHYSAMRFQFIATLEQW